MLKLSAVERVLTVPDRRRKPQTTRHIRRYVVTGCHDDRVSLSDRPDPRAADPRRPTAADWLAAPTPAGDLDLVVMGVPRFAGSTAPSSAHATPAAVRRSLAGLTTWAPSRGVDVARLKAVDRADVTEPDGEEGEWR